MVPSSRNGTGTSGQYALVSYVPEPLASFLNKLRRELEPGFPHWRAHITLLPPRPLADRDAAWTRLRELADQIPAIRIEPASVLVFATTSVIHLSVGAGSEELRLAHGLLNSGALGCEELHPYCPHITLAQSLEPHQIDDAARRAAERWAGYRGDRSFLADRFSFVHNADGNWVDLSEWEAGVAPAVRRPPDGG